MAVPAAPTAHTSVAPLPQTAWLLGDARAAAGDAAGARAAYDRVVQGGRAFDRRTLALFYATQGIETDEAVRLAEQERAVRGDLYSEDAFAWALFRAGRLAEAGRAAGRALRLGTQDARLLYHAGAIKIASGERTEGLALVRRAVALNPEFDAIGATEARALLARDSGSARVATSGRQR